MRSGCGDTVHTANWRPIGMDSDSGPSLRFTSVTIEEAVPELEPKPSTSKTLDSAHGETAN